MILPDYVSADLEGKWGWSFPWNLKSYWTNIGLNNTAFRKTRILLPSSSEYKYIRYWGRGAYKTSLLPTEADKDSWIKEKVQFCKKQVLSSLEENLWWAFLILFCPASTSFCTIFSFFDFFRINLDKFLRKARNQSKLLKLKGKSFSHGIKL